MTLETQFPQPEAGQFLKAADFQDNEKTLTYRGWERKANVDRVKDGQVVKTWKDCLDYCLKYSYPEIARDKAGDTIPDDNGQPMKNRNYLPEYPQGYSIVYHFEEGQLESGSSPLFNAFKRVQPKVGEKLCIMRTGETTETKWFVCRAEDRQKKEVPEQDMDEFGAYTKLPF